MRCYIRKSIYTNKEQLMIRQPYDKYLLNNFFTAEGLFCTPPGARRINWQRGWRRRALSRNGIHIFINKTKRKRNGTTYYNKYFWLSKNKLCLGKLWSKAGRLAVPDSPYGMSGICHGPRAFGDPALTLYMQAVSGHENHRFFRVYYRK